MPKTVRFVSIKDSFKKILPLDFVIQILIPGFWIFRENGGRRGWGQNGGGSCLSFTVTIFETFYFSVCFLP